MVSCTAVYDTKSITEEALIYVLCKQVIADSENIIGIVSKFLKIDDLEDIHSNIRSIFKKKN